MASRSIRGDQGTGEAGGLGARLGLPALLAPTYLVALGVSHALWQPGESFRLEGEGALAKHYESDARGKRHDAIKFRDRFRGTCKLLREGEIERATRGLRPDLLLTSSGTPWVGIAACRTGVPVVSFSSTRISVEAGVGIIRPPAETSRPPYLPFCPSSLELRGCLSQ